jgi:small ubiquitin-related modifier
VFFRIKRSTQLKKLMNAYCDRQSVDMNAIAFLFDGRRLRAEQTPDEVWAVIFLQIPELKMHYDRVSLLSSLPFQLEMEDGDEIDAMLHRTGGCLPPIA